MVHPAPACVHDDDIAAPRVPATGFDFRVSQSACGFGLVVMVEDVVDVILAGEHYFSIGAPTRLPHSVQEPS